MALVMTIVVMAVVGGIGGIVVLLAGTETRLAALEQVRIVERGLAEVQMERAFQDLARAEDWNAVLSGAARSSFVGASDRPYVAGWGIVDLARRTTELQAQVGTRWGPDAPRWRLYSHGRGSDLLPGSPDPARAYYTAAWVADDQGDGDGRGEVDANGVVMVRGEAIGPYGSRQVWVATIRRVGGPVGGGVEVLSLRSPPEG
jgi:hypothetical protein